MKKLILFFSFMMAAVSMPTFAVKNSGGTPHSNFGDAFSIFGASRKQVKEANQLVINKGLDDEMSLMFSEFTTAGFSDGNIFFDNSDSLTLPVSSIQTLHFTKKEPSASVESVGDNAVNFIYNGYHLSANGLPDNCRLDIYALTGILMISADRYNGEPVSLRDLPAGIYLAKACGQTFKFIKK